MESASSARPSGASWNGDLDSPLDWPLGSADVALDARDIHVWRADLAISTSDVARLGAWLSPEEGARAERFRFERHRNAFIAARGVLRGLLGRWTGVHPRDVKLALGAHGKPRLEPGEFGVTFNVSHSGGVGLFAFARGRELGVDVEHIRPDFVSDDIARRFFAPAEVDALFALPDDARQDAFFRCWTRKEAYIKAIGEGLSRPLRGFSVSLAPGEPAMLLRVDGDESEAARWRMEDLPVGGGYAGALIAPAGDWRLRRYQWTMDTL